MMRTGPRFSTLWFVIILVLGTAGCRLLSAATPAATPVETAPVVTTADSPTVIPTETESPTQENTASSEPEEITATVEPTQAADAGFEPGDALLPGAAGIPAPDTVNHYEIDVEIDFEDLSFQGSQVVDFINTETVPLEALYFRLLPNGGLSYGNGRLEVNQVSVEDQPVATELSQGDMILEIPLQTPLQAGDRTRVSLAFEGKVPRDFGGGYGIFNFSDDVMTLAGWYPILAVYDADGWNLDPVSSIGDSVYSDIAYYEVEVSLPSEMILAATGAKIGLAENGTLVTQRLASGPVRDFFMVLSPDFMVETTEVDGVSINSYYLPGNSVGGGKALEVAADSLGIFNEQFGLYPYTELDVVESPMRYAAGVEFPGIILIGDFLYENPNRDFFTIATSHEVAHQWWYNVVGNDVFDEPWLDEGLTTYSSSLYYEFKFNPETYANLIDIWQLEYLDAAGQGADDIVTESLQYFEENPNPGVYSVVAYTKGALFYHALRQELGDETFFRGLQTYYDAYRYQVASTEDMLAVFEEVSGQQLDGLYQEWLYASEIPSSIENNR